MDNFSIVSCKTHVTRHALHKTTSNSALTSVTCVYEIPIGCVFLPVLDA